MLRSPLIVIVLLTLVALLAACAHPPEWQGTLDAWVGQEADQLVRRWGIPNSSYTFKDGTRALVYSYSLIDETPATTHCYEDDGKTRCYTSGGYTHEYVCEATFAIAPSNLIASAAYDGDWTGCTRFFNKYGGPTEGPLGSVGLNLAGYTAQQGASVLQNAPSTTFSVGEFRQTFNLLAFPGSIGERKTIFDLSFGEVILDPPAEELVREAVVAELEAAGHHQNATSPAVSVTGDVRKFALRTDATLLYWDVAVSAAVSIRLAAAADETIRDYSVDCVERTYEYLDEETMTPIISACVRKLMLQFRNDEGVARFLAALHP